MSTAALKAAATQATGTAVATREPSSFPQFLQAYQGEIARALPKHLNADRMSRIALTEFRKNPQLAECDPKSIFASVIMLSQLGLEPGVLGQAYLVPYKNHKTKKMECQGIPGWKGLVDLVSRTGRATVSTQAVYADDDFQFQFGTEPYLRHIPSKREPEHRADFLYVYAVGRVKGAAEPIFDVWSHERVSKHRDRFNKVGDSHYSFSNFEMYARKVVLLQVLKYLPASPELQTAMELEIGSDRGQGLDLSNVVDGQYSAPPPADEPGNQAYTEEEAIRAAKETVSLEDLELARKSVWSFYAQAKQEIPIAVEATFNDRKEALSKI